MKKHKIFAALAIVICLGVTAGIVGCQNSQDKGKEAGDSGEKELKPRPLREKEYKEIPRKVGKKKDDPYKNTVDFESLWQTNSDVYAWVKIPNTAVDYPILQSVSEPDDYYLNRTIELYEGYPGSIYTEKYNRQDFFDPVTVVYGHDMLDGSMFADLHKYENADFFAKNPYFYIYLPDETLKYQIFSAVAFDDRHILGHYNFSDKENVMNFYNDLMSCERGNTDSTVIVTKYNKIVSLSTCIAERPDQRWIVSGVLLSVKKNME